MYQPGISCVCTCMHEVRANGCIENQGFSNGRTSIWLQKFLHHSNLSLCFPPNSFDDARMKSRRMFGHSQPVVKSYLINCGSVIEMDQLSVASCELVAFG